MAETTNEKEYIIPLRREWLKVPRYRRAGRAIKAIKEYIAKHMKVPDRNVANVKIDMHFNQEIWFRGRRSPPHKIKVKAIKDGDLVRVELADLSEHAKFAKAKHEKRHKEAEAEEKKKPAEPEKPVEEKTEEEKKEEEEKAKSAEEQHTKEAEMQAKAQKHIIKVKEPKIQRKALKK